MDYFIMARHGHDDGVNLDYDGICQIDQLVAAIRTYAGEAVEDFRILTSPKVRAKQSAERIAKALNIDTPQEYEELFTDTDGKVYEIVGKHREAGGLIVVTHKEVANSFPSFFHLQEYTTRLELPIVYQGEALACHQGQWTQLPSGKVISETG